MNKQGLGMIREWGRNWFAGGHNRDIRLWWQWLGPLLLMWPRNGGLSMNWKPS